jgi:protein disulfide-isomerase
MMNGKKFMKKLSIAFLAISFLVTVRAEESSWLKDVPAAQKKAANEHKLVMMDFTGSDWCGWCIKLHEEVFSQPEFKTYAAKNLVLVELDFPRKKEQDKELKKANHALQKQYNIEGYPTIVVLNGAGKEVGRLGYMKGGPKAFIGELEALKKKG